MSDDRDGITPTPCPCCGAAMESATFMGPEDKRPKPGDLSLCLYCGATLVFTDNLGVRLATPKELRELPEDFRGELERQRDRLPAIRLAVLRRRRERN